MKVHLYLFLIFLCLPLFLSSQQLSGKWVTSDGDHIFEFLPKRERLLIFDRDLRDFRTFDYRVRDFEIDLYKNGRKEGAMPLKLLSNGTLQ